MDTFKNRGSGSWRRLALLAVMTSTAVLAQPPPPPPGGAGGGIGTQPPPALPPVNPPPTTPPPGGAGGGQGLQPDPSYWGAFKTDKCTRSGYVQKSAILWGIQGSWEDTCRHKGATIDGFKFDHPTRCVRTTTAMWGEFDVPNTSCLPSWAGFKKDKCTGVGVRQYSSQLVNIKDIDWNDACMQTPAFIENESYPQAARCRTTRLSGQWGEFDVPDPSCGPYP